VPATTDDNERIASLEEWLAVRLHAKSVRRAGDVRRPEGSGFSAATLIFDAVVDRGAAETEERFVVRLEEADAAVYPQQAPGLDVEIDLQYRVMEAFARHAPSIPIAPLIGYEADRSLLGAPFFAMRFVDGQVPIENPLYTRTGFFADATPDQRRAMVENGVEVLARLHRLDWQAAGLDWLIAPGATPTTATQLELWEQYASRELGDRKHPLLDRAFSWLHAHAPESESPPGLCWGDPRPGNMIWQDFRCACVTDFEAAAIAPVDVDLGWWLMFDRFSHEAQGVDRLAGEPTRDDQRELYASFADRAIADTYYYEVLAAARYAAIVVRVMNRAVDRGVMPADQTIWLDNPAADTLAQLLDS
jgi:aminoglycoside phosphotransferase (APT) family kinase protein